MTVLAEKLAQRKDLVTKIGRLDDEIAAAMVYEEGETGEQTDAARDQAVAEVDAGMNDLVDALLELEAIENEIRAANSNTLVQFEGEWIMLSKAIVKRDRLKTEFNARTKIADEIDEQVGRKRNRYDYGLRSKDQVRRLSAVPPKDLRDDADKVAKRLRLLDAEIQKVNWSTEV
jgi:hypothetical protein